MSIFALVCLSRISLFEKYTYAAGMAYKVSMTKFKMKKTQKSARYYSEVPIIYKYYNKFRYFNL